MPALPIFTSLRGYQASWLPRDLTAGIAIAAVGLPSAIAYPAIAGLPAQMGVYSSIIPLIAYALFGSSRRLIVGPDAGTMIVLAAVLASLAPGSVEERVTLTAAIGLIVGVLCLVASVLRLGFVASFLSRPILLGFMSGTSVSILIGQIGRFTGVKIESEGLIRPIAELGAKIDMVNWPTVALGVALFAIARMFAARSSRIPGPLVVVVLALALSLVVDLPAMGVAIVGPISVAVPTPHVPFPTPVAPLDLATGAVAILLVSFGSGIVTARAFANRDDEVVYANRELIGFGAANIGAGLFGGIPVTASDSRTAINFATGGKSQLAGVTAAVVLMFAVLFFSDVLRLLPVAALGAILASAAIGLIDVKGLIQLWRISRMEFAFAMIAMAGAIGLGVLRGVILAVVAALIYILIKGLRPRDAMLGRIEGRDGFFKLHRQPEARQIPGVAICLFQGSLLFFNVDYVKSRFEEIANSLEPGTKWLILDASAIVQIDSTAAAMLEDVRGRLALKGITFGIAELHKEPQVILDRSGTLERIGPKMVFVDLEDAREAALKLDLTATPDNARRS